MNEREGEKARNTLHKLLLQNNNLMYREKYEAKYYANIARQIESAAGKCMRLVHKTIKRLFSAYKKTFTTTYYNSVQ